MREFSSDNNWLFRGYSGYGENLISPASGNSTGGAAITYAMLEYLSSNISSKSVVYPVVVLKTNVKVTGGNGTSGNPYTLGLSE